MTTADTQDVVTPTDSRNGEAGRLCVQRMVRLLAIAVIEADEPQCLTPARCMMRHGPHCRVTRWEAIVGAITTEMAKQPNEKL